MGLRIIAGDGEGDSGTYAVLYCSTVMEALPWIFDDRDEAEAFVEKHGDVRRLSPAEQREAYDAWRARRAEHRAKDGMIYVGDDPHLPECSAVRIGSPCDCGSAP